MQEWRRVGSIIQKDKTTGTYSATLIYEGSKSRRTFTKWFAEGGYEAAKRWSQNYANELPRHADRMAEVFFY